MSKKNLTPWWKGFLTSILGTTISIALTFGTTALVNNKKKLNAQRLTAMMVIHDIDKSIETLKKIKQEDQEGYQAAMYVQEHIDSIESLSNDTLNIVFNYLLEGISVDDDLEFNESSEKMFHSTQDTWTNLDDMTFIRNVEDFYKSRQVLKKTFAENVTWKKPVSQDESDVVINDSDIMDSWEDFCGYIKELLGKKRRCRTYIHNYLERERLYYQGIKEWTNMNEQNKFLMNISDQELAEFVENTSRQSRPATDKDLIGTWVNSAVDAHITEFDLHNNHTFRYFQSISMQGGDYSGKGYLEVTVGGEWKTEGDSLVIVYDVSSIKVDINEKDIVFRQETRDSVRRSLQSFKDRQVPIVRQSLEANGRRRTQATNIDITGNSLELTKPDGETWHYKRKK